MAMREPRARVPRRRSSGRRGELSDPQGLRWVLAYSGRDPRWNDVPFGAIVAIFALVRASGAYREEIVSWANAAIGVWLIVAAFTIDYTARASWNDIILGIIVLLLALGSAEATAHLFRRE